ncbi:MAG: class I SAM-dependent methyltransferase [Acidobacteria bacterium]|nr:class I SAM-dependent methyltransferase [Acidobacteriota bacterium]
MDLCDVGLPGEFLRGQPAQTYHQGRDVRVHFRHEFPLGAVRAVGAVRVRSPGSGRQLQRPGLLIIGLGGSMDALFFELFSGLPRQGPGEAASTLRALALVPGVGPGTRVLDIGCGTGAQTLVLAKGSAAHIVAVDNHAPFVDFLNREALRLGLTHRLEARVADMGRLDFGDGSFEVIWSEGAIYNIGFEVGLRDWRRLLADGGHIVVTEACWRRPDPPGACEAFWREEYPDMRDVPALLQAVDRCGYETVAHFPLPASAWWDDYYRPLQDNVTAFRRRYPGRRDAQELADGIQREIDVWHAFSECYGYQFFVLRAR